MIELHDNEKYDHFVAMNVDIKVVILLLIFIILLFIIIVGSNHQLFFKRVWQVGVNTKKNDNEKQKRVSDSFLEGSHFQKYYKRKRTKKKNRYHDRNEIKNSTALSSLLCWNDFKEYIVLRLIPHSLKNVGYWFPSKTYSNIVDSNDESNNEERIYIGLDCEMVGAGRHGVESLLARCTLVTMDHQNEVQVLYDEYVKPSKTVTDYRTQYSGITPHHLSFCAKVTVDQCRMQVMNILSNNENKKAILVGHGLENDFQVLKFQVCTHVY